MSTTSVISPELLEGTNRSASKAGDNPATSPEAIQNRFLTMLAVQLQNQDPMNPMSNAELTSQITGLSTLAGINQLNTRMDQLMDALGAARPLLSANMIGHGVFAPGNRTELATEVQKYDDGTEITKQRALFGVKLEQPVDNLKVTIRDKSGNIIHQMDLGRQDAGVLPILWDGSNDAGARLPDGQYTFEVTASLGGASVPVQALAFGRVISVMSGVDGVKLSATNIGTISMSDIVQILG